MGVVGTRRAVARALRQTGRNRSGVPKPDFSGAFRGECARTRAEDCTQVLDEVLGGRKPALEVPAGNGWEVVGYAGVNGRRDLDPTRPSRVYVRCERQRARSPLREWITFVAVHVVQSDQLGDTCVVWRPGCDRRCAGRGQGNCVGRRNLRSTCCDKLDEGALCRALCR